ncbi:MAG: hypothetical protein ACJ8KU_11315 [Chthoniobacterales bacterium]
MRLKIRQSVVKPALIALIVSAFAVQCAQIAAAAPNDYLVYVSNERSGDMTIIDGSANNVVATIRVGKRPRGIRVSPDGKRVFVVLSGSPRMAPGVEENRAPADKAADGMAIIDTAAQKVIEKWHAGSDPEQLALSKDGALAFIANEDDASLSTVALSNGQTRGKVKVSEEPEGVGVNPVNGEVYVTCEEKGDVFVISPQEQRVLAQITIGGRPRSVAFTPDGTRAFVACENAGRVVVLDAQKHSVSGWVALPSKSLPMGTVISPDGNELYVTTGRGNTVVVVDTKKNNVAAIIPVGERVWGEALSPDGSKLYTANGTTNDVSVVDARGRKELTRIKVGDGPWGVAIVPKP